MKAILDGRDFNYLAARPVQKLDGDAVKALVKLGAEYAKGGSRRTLAVEGATLQEPATALLGKLGAKIPTQVGKQLLDIGSICHMIFTPDGRQEDKSKSVLKSCFVPVRAEEELTQSAKQQDSGEGQPLYTIDPLADVARAQENYSSEAGNIDLSSMAPQAAQQLNYEASSMPSLESQSEPSSSFGDFGMGLVSALAPQNAAQSAQPATAQQAMSFENLSEGSRSAELPSLPFAANPPAGELSANSSTPPPLRSAMDALPPTGPSVSFTGLASMPNQPLPDATTSLTGMPSAASSALGTSSSSSMTGLTGITPSGGNGQADRAAEWFIMSHEAIPAAALAADLNQVSPTPAAIPAPPREDFSQQFLSDWHEGHAGQAGFTAAEEEFERERRLKKEGQRGKEQRLRDYFGEEHFQKYVPGEISEPDMDKVDAWEMAREYHSEPTTAEGPNFDADIFANAGRSTLETNPGAVVLDSETEEITGPPPDPSWAMPMNVEAVKPRTSDRSFQNMLEAVKETPVSENTKSAGEAESQAYAPESVPNLSILDALQTQPQSLSTPPPAAQELGPIVVPADSPVQPNSLFDRLTGELSKDQPGTGSPDNLSAEQELSSPTQPSEALDQPAPTTLNWAPPPSAYAEESALRSSGGVWPDVAPSESLFATGDDEGEEAFKQSSSETSAVDRWAQSEPFESTGAELAQPTAASAPAEKIAEEPPAAIPWPSAVEEPAAPDEPAWSSSVEEPPSAVKVSDSFVDLAPVTTASVDSAPTTQAEQSVAADTQAEAQAPADMQQPRVRPRDYSSPLRGSRSSTGSDLLSPMTPHPTVTKNNLPAQLPPGSLTAPPAAASTPTPFSVPRASSTPASSKGQSPPVVPTPAAPAEQVADLDLTPAPDLTIAPDLKTPDLDGATPAAPDLSPAPDLAPAAEAEADITPKEQVSETEAQTPQAAASEQIAPIVPPPSSAVSSASTLEKAPTALPFRSKPATLAGSSSSDSLPNLASLSAAQTGASGDNQDARLMMNEMTSLMSKLEMQVAKAANKMASRAEELRGRLSQQVDELVNEAQNVEKQAESNLFTLASELKTKLEALALEVETSLASDATNAQLSIEEIAQIGWDKLESEQMQLALDITRSGEDFRQQLEKLASSVSGRLDSLIEDRNEELISLSETIAAQLKESHDTYHIKVAQRYERFEQRMNEETASISGSLDRNMRSMVEEIETSLDRACEKLKNTKFELRTDRRAYNCHFRNVYCPKGQTPFGSDTSAAPQ